jgi:hypothetical protein
MGHKISKFSNDDNSNDDNTTESIEYTVIKPFQISLPSEIIDKILENVALDDKETILQCQLICKRCQLSINRRIYRRVNFTIGMLNEDKFMRKIKRDPSIGKMVQEIKFDYWERWFSLLVRYFPNLRFIFCSRSCEYFPLLLDVLQRGDWKKLNKVQIATPGYSEKYAEIALEIRDRLSEYTVYDEVTDDRLVEKTHNQLAEHLVSFPKLQSVEFLIYQAKHIFEFDKYIDDCACYLNKIKLTTICTESDLENNFQNLTMPYHDSLSQIKQRPLVKQLHAQILLACDDSLLYLMQKFPSLLDLQLNASFCHARQDTLNRRISTNLSLQTISLFLLYLLNIPSFDIRKFYMKDACSLLHLPINVIAAKTGVKCRLVIYYQTVFSTMSYYHHPCVNINRSERSKIIFLEVCIYTNENILELPHLCLLESAGQQVRDLELSMGSVKDFLEGQWRNLLDESISKMLDGLYFSHLLTHCSQLSELHITSSALLDCGFNNQIKHTNLTKLTVTNCLIYPGIFKDLSSRLPSLSYLDMDYCHFVSKNGNKDEHESNNYFSLDMPYTRFQYLRWGIRCKYNEFCLRLVKDSGIETYFKGKLVAGTMTFCRKVSKYHSDGYQSSRCSDKIATIDIRCADIKKLEVCVNFAHFSIIDC